MIAQINALSIFIPRLHDGVTSFGIGVPAHGFFLNSEQTFGLIYTRLQTRPYIATSPNSTYAHLTTFHSIRLHACYVLELRSAYYIIASHRTNDTAAHVSGLCAVSRLST
jgi:hypothetical protein